MALLVDAYARALQELDLPAWTLFTALQARIVTSACSLLQQLEVTALQPALAAPQTSAQLTAAAAGSVSGALHSGPAETSSTAALKAGQTASPSSSACRVGEYVTCGLKADALSKRCLGSAAGTDPSAVSISQRLEQELLALRKVQRNAEPSMHSASTVLTASRSMPPPLVFSQLSESSQAALCLSALWMCTKLFGTLSESSTLCGLVALLVRQHHQQQQQQQQRQSSLRHSDAVQPVPPTSSSTPPPTPAVEASSFPLASPIAVPSAQCSTEPHNAATPDLAPTMYPSNTSAGAKTSTELQLGFPPAACEASAMNAVQALQVDGVIAVGGYDGVGYDALVPPPELLPPPGVWQDEVGDAMDALARDVEDAEVILLRCSSYSIPV